MVKCFLKIIFIGQAIFIVQCGCCCNKKNKSKKTTSSKPVPPINPTKVPPINPEFKGTRIDKPQLNPPKAPEQTLENLRCEGYTEESSPKSVHNEVLKKHFGIDSDGFTQYKGKYRSFKYVNNDKNNKYIRIFSKTRVFIKKEFYEEIKVENKEKWFTKFNDNLYHITFKNVNGINKCVTNSEEDKEVIKFENLSSL